MLEKLKKAIRFVVDPPTTRDGPDTLTLAVPNAQSTCKRGADGWAHRPPALVRCPGCSAEFEQEYANDVLRCPTCRFEQSPDGFDEVELIQLTCPHCQAALDHGIRHPNLFDVPQWASCPSCRYHWELNHF